MVYYGTDNIITIFTYFYQNSVNKKKQLFLFINLISSELMFLWNFSKSLMSKIMFSVIIWHIQIIS